MKNKSDLLDRLGVVGQERMLLGNVLDRALQASRREAVFSTPFLSPQEQILVRRLLHLAGIGEDGYVFEGGHDEAQRRMVVFLPSWMEREQSRHEGALSALRLRFAGDQELSHRDVLGSLMAMGIERERVGDIFVATDSCDVVVADTIADYLLSDWDSAGRVKISVSAIAIDDVVVPEVKVVLVRDTVMSLRLDAIAASGFSMARGKIVPYIDSGRAQVNHVSVTKGDKILAQGDVVSIRGLGKIELSEVGGLSRKGRTGIVIKRFI